MPPALLVLAQSAFANADLAALTIERVARERRLPAGVADTLFMAADLCLNAASEAQHVVEALAGG